MERCLRSWLKFTIWVSSYNSYTLKKNYITTFILLEKPILLGELEIDGESRVGSKGEIFLPKEIREKLGLKPHTKFIYKVENGRLLIEPILKLEDVLKEPKPVEITLENFHEFRRELSRKVES